MLRPDAVPRPVWDLLKLLATSPSLGDFTLGGGTSLAIRFGHRVSVDLDFFTTREFDPEELAGKAGLEKAVQVNRASNSLALDLDGTKVEFLRHAYPLLEPVEEFDGIRMLSLPDVAAMKLNAIANRGAKKDFFDLVELARHHPLSAMLGWFERKYRNADRFTVIRSLAWFEDAEMEPDPVSLSDTSWQDVKSTIRRLVSGIG